LLRRDVGSILVESKSLHLFKCVGNIFSRRYSLKIVKNLHYKLRRSVYCDRQCYHATRLRYEIEKKMTDGVLLFTVMSKVIAFYNYSRLIT
jgi:hypothetical protein